MSSIMEFVRREPVLVTGLVEAFIVLVVAFGADLTAEQIGGILGFVAILTSVVARMFVSPTSEG